MKASSSSSSLHHNKQCSVPKSALTLLRELQSSKRLSLVEAFPLPLGITSLAGAAGSGKTQLCLSLLADCAWNRQTAIYISIGSDFSARVSKRLHDIFQYRLAELKSSSSSSVDNTKYIKKTYLSLIYLNWIRNPDDLLELLNQRLHSLLRTQKHTGVVILDGIATLFRGNMYNQWRDRSATFFKVASRCKALSQRHQVPFVITNEATTKINSLTSNLEPALGLSWAQCVNCSLFVHRTANRRILKCLKASHIPSDNEDTGVCDFTICRKGTVQIKDL